MGNFSISGQTPIDMGKPPAPLGETRIGFAETAVTVTFRYRPRETGNKPMRDYIHGGAFLGTWLFCINSGFG